MREIKFRAWEEEFGMMFYPREKQFQQMVGEKTHKLCGGHKPQGALSAMYEVDCPLMQYTGLLDKNGKEIYEGDILRIDEPPRENNKVEFYEGEYQLIPHGLRLTDWYEVSEVIGNIYENKELLEV